MKIFEQREIRKAYEYAMSGETAVHLHFVVFPNSPSCFRRDVEKGFPIAHVFSQDKDLLRSLAQRHGIRRVVVSCQGKHNQHVDFCGRPLKELLTEMGRDLQDYKKDSEK